MTIQLEKKRKGSSKSSSCSFSWFSSPSILPILLSGIDANTSTNSFTVVVTAMIISSACSATTIVTTSPIMTSEPDLPHKPITDLLDKPSRKREKEHSCFSSFSLSLDAMCAEFQCFMAFCSAAGNSLLSSHSRSARDHCSHSPAVHSSPSSSSVTQERATCFASPA